MAPSSGHVLVPKALKALRYAVSKTTSLIRARISEQAAKATHNLTFGAIEAIPARVTRQPIHPFATLRQSRSGRSRFFTTAARHLSRNLSETFPTAFDGVSKYTASTLPQSATRAVLSRTTCAPFSTTLRPNLVGGALPRSVGGYSLGGVGRRAFSSAPMAQAQVVQNVSAAVRAFCVQGFRPQYDGIDPNTGRARFATVTKNQEVAGRKIRSHADAAASGMIPRNVDRAHERGASLSFSLAPAVTALSAIEAASLDDASVLDELAADFSTARNTLLKVQADLKRLSALGPLPVSMPDSTHIEVRFPGCDADSVNRLCEEFGVFRGLVREDPGWTPGETGDRDVDMALLFPWAPVPASENDADGCFHYGKQLGWESMLTTSAISHSLRARSTLGVSNVEDITSVNSGSHISFDEITGSDGRSNASFSLALNDNAERAVWSDMATPSRVEEFEGVEGIYKFLHEIHSAGS